MSDTRHVQVAIVGGGLVGASAALALASRGASVALFERRFCGAQASGVNYGGGGRASWAARVVWVV
ncbi:FAD-dependent oxidoreductase [Burkholderia sp. Ac-20379]|uniref:FAD-dependent oxidoreductase n=1 Tax=Burkholderia sp. Ac-20379 TaxID=2703900 RepID=UPI002402B52C|nr:FAD-dependent oxidoreductase [Burkholderia sp. Ac-20379]